MSLYVSVFTMSTCLCADVSFFLLSRHVFYVSCLLKCVPCFCMCLCVLCLLVCVSGFHVFACESVFHVSVCAYVYMSPCLYAFASFFSFFLCLCTMSLVCACVPCLLFVQVCSMTLYMPVYIMSPCLSAFVSSSFCL